MQETFEILLINVSTARVSDPARRSLTCPHDDMEEAKLYVDECCIMSKTRLKKGRIWIFAKKIIAPKEPSKTLCLEQSYIDANS